MNYEDIAIETIQNETQRKKRLKNKTEKESIGELWDNVKCPDTHVTTTSEK